jgi:hypothetical protein
MMANGPELQIRPSFLVSVGVYVAGAGTVAKASTPENGKSEK